MRKNKKWIISVVTVVVILLSCTMLVVFKSADNTGNTISNTYTLEVDSEEAEKYLDDLNYDYKNFN